MLPEQLERLGETTKDVRELLHRVELSAQLAAAPDQAEGVRDQHRLNALGWTALLVVEVNRLMEILAEESNHGA